MLEKIFHWLTGYAAFTVEGDASRFLNVAAKSGFTMWGFSKRGSLALVSVKAREYPRLRSVCRRCQVKIGLEKKGGLPFQTLRLWRRKGLLIGLFCAMAIGWVLSGFVWGITISGTDRLTDAQVIKAAEASGLYIGVRRDSFQPKMTGYQITKKLGSVSWVSVNTDSCFAEVVVEESISKPEITNDNVWSNIVADSAGQILEIQAEHGRQEVSIGDTVKPGDLLISGIYPDRVDPYGPQPEKPMATFGAARGRVVAETYREFTVQAGSRKIVEIPLLQGESRWSLSVLGLKIPLGLQEEPQGDTREYTKRFPLVILGRELPVYAQMTGYQPVESVTIELAGKKLEDEALRKLREAQKAAISPGGAVIEEELTYTMVGDLCILQAKCRCREDIGRIQEIKIEG